MPYPNLIPMTRRGPRTAGGKASRRNALKHGLGATAPVVRQVESVEDWNWHLEQVIADRQPEGYLETQLAVRIHRDLPLRGRRVLRPYTPSTSQTEGGRTT